MNDILKAKNMGVCIKTNSGEVLFQNTSCENYCGQRTGTKCKDRCMKDYNESLRQQPNFHSKQKVEIDQNLFDICHIHDGNQHITLLLDLSKKLNTQLSQLKEFDLSTRETEIIQLILMGHKNGQIAEKLFISRSTVKSHINNLYAKIPAVWIDQNLPQRRTA